MGKKAVQVWLSLASYGRVRSAAASDGVSLQEWVAEAVREKLLRDESGVSLVLDPVVEMKLSGSGRVAEPDWDAILAAGRAGRVPVYKVDTVDVDPLEGIA